MTTSRREFIAGSGAVIAALASLRARASEGADSPAEKLLAEIAEEILADYPENATSLGIDNGARAALKARLSDRSANAQLAIAHRVAARLEKLRAIDASALAEGTRIDLDVVRTAHETAAAGLAFPYGEVALLNQNWSWRNAPYVVAQNTGAFLEIPSLLTEQHTIETREDAEAYLERLEAYAGQLDGETGRLNAAAAQGVIAPDFLLDKTLAQIKTARSGNVADWSLVTSIAERAKDLPGDFGAQAAKIATDKMRPRSSARPPSWKCTGSGRPATPACGSSRRAMRSYAWTLRAATTTMMTPDEIHDRGREELAALQSEMDAILKKQGLTQEPWASG